jgi:hypothetical protein
VNIGPAEFIVILVVAVIFLVFPLWALVDASMRTNDEFERIGQSRGTWIVLLLGGHPLFHDRRCRARHLLPAVGAAETVGPG